MARSLAKNNAHFRRALRRLPLGVSSNFRYWGDDKTLYVKRGRGARVWDLDDNEYVDYRLGYGPVILGHAEIERGRVYFQGNTYTIRRGSIDFDNPERIDPRFDIEAETRVRPLFDAIAGKVFYVGAEPGLGQITKLANNMISAAGMAASMEAAVMAVKAGVDARTLIDVVNASTGRNSATEDKFPQSILPRTFDYGGKVATMYKDVELCFAEARALGVPMWVGAAVVQLWFQAMSEGRGQDDYTTLIKVIEGWTGVTVGGGGSAG